jgi:hypothetical protein
MWVLMWVQTVWLTAMFFNFSKLQEKSGGESGIRTHGRVSPTHAFQACSFNHSDISPFRINHLRVACEDYRTRWRLLTPSPDPF